MHIFGGKVLSDFKLASQKEWLITNGLGGFASSTIIGTNTRCYHGLLIASLQVPAKRIMLLSKIEEELEIDGATYHLSTNLYPNKIIYPEGYQHQSIFYRYPFPTQIFQIENITITKQIIMIYNENKILISYHINNPAHRQIQIRLSPLVNYRDIHKLTEESSNFISKIKEIKKGKLYIYFQDGEIPLGLQTNLPNWKKTGYWFRNFFYQKESYRGLASSENCYNPGYFEGIINESEKSIIILASAGENSLVDEASIKLEEYANQQKENELNRQENLLELLPIRNEITEPLALAADQFIVRRNIIKNNQIIPLKSIIAGYHWFTDWGRDAMISLTGLTLTTRRYELARQILRLFNHYISDGMLPNCLPEKDETPEYNTIDAALWYFIAIHKFLQYTNDLDFIIEIYQGLEEIITSYMRGTRYNIHQDNNDSLLIGGTDSTQITWMDAKVDDWAITSRTGKAVEINALWYNALCIIANLTEKINGKGQIYRELAKKVSNSFNRVFWNKEQEYLYDVIKSDGEKDESLRPNQILAISLPYNLLSPQRELAVLQTVHRHLYTPYGLRSLAPNEINYHNNYGGNKRNRDIAYHQGTVWSWLLGPFISAYVKIHKPTIKTRKQAYYFIQPIIAHLNEIGLGTISEIFDGDQPYSARGCISQAWSVAEILRAYIEDILGIIP